MSRYSTLFNRKKYVREYYAWRGMNQRCYNVKDKNYPRYGGRGITVCDEWRGRGTFDTFMMDMGECPKGYQLDRIDNNEGYSPDNCQWASIATQARNRRSTKLSWEKVEAIRKDDRLAKIVAKEHGVCIQTIWNVRYGKRWVK